MTNENATKTSKPAAPKFSVKDLAEKIGQSPKKTRAMIREMASESDSPRLRHEGKSYEWNGRDFQVIVRQLSKRIEAQESECSADCTASVSDKCVCHCGGANHGIHASH